MRAPRKDVLRNRRRVVAAARAAFVQLGPDVSLEEIARRAGVGATTLYRHFADREALAEADPQDLNAAGRHNSDLAPATSHPLEAVRQLVTMSCRLCDRET